MQVSSETRSSLLPLDRERTWPLDARMAMFVLEAGGQPDPVEHAAVERNRSTERQPCRMVGTVCDNRDLHGHAIVYVRDLADRHIGFICQNSLPVGKTVWLHCSTDDGKTLRTPCQIGRSRQFMSGWNEGVLHVCD